MNRKTITAVAAMTLSATLAFAAPQSNDGKKFEGKRGRHGHGAHHRGDRAFAKLNLTDAQKAQVKTLREQFKTENAQLFSQLRQARTDLKTAREANDTARLESLRGSMDSLKAQFKAAKKAHRERLLTILTPEQRAQLETSKQERRNRR
ncbi:MAG TPA: Spy/CpxP family protein refolding chaperone [Thermoanaerobaculia bacterium]|jgi:Spy/CpxP family protein refolding chaperone